MPEIYGLRLKKGWQNMFSEFSDKRNGKRDVTYAYNTTEERCSERMLGASGLGDILGRTRTQHENSGLIREESTHAHAYRASG